MHVDDMLATPRADSRTLWIANWARLKLSFDGHNPPELLQDVVRDGSSCKSHYCAKIQRSGVSSHRLIWF